jgi:hypothetical protein
VAGQDSESAQATAGRGKKEQFGATLERANVATMPMLTLGALDGLTQGGRRK